MIDTSIDGHVHTPYCNHANGTMEEYVVSAINKGLKQIIFLEHLEKGIQYFESTWLSDNDFEKYFNEGKKLKEKYKNQIDVGLGVEVGYNPNCKQMICDFLSLYQWDRVGVSYHFLSTDGPHVNLFSSKQINFSLADQYGLQNVVDKYYEDLLEALDVIPADVVCHLDAVLRWHPDICMVDHQPGLNMLLNKISAKGLALEINTAGLKVRGDTFPTLQIVKKAHQMDIPLWLGSDSHKPEDVGRYFEQLPGLLLDG